MLNGLFYKMSVRVEPREDILSNLCLFLGCGTAKVIKRNAEPLVDLIVDFAVFVADFEWCHTFFCGLGFGGSAVLVRPTNKQRIDAAETTIARINVGAEHTT